MRGTNANVFKAMGLAMMVHFGTMPAKSARRLVFHPTWSLAWAQVQLYAELQPGALLPFLAASQSYSLEPALAVCERHGLVPEQVPMRLTTFVAVLQWDQHHP